jgi:hypothetical protein
MSKLIILSIADGIAKGINFHDVINDFEANKVRQVVL